MAKLEIKPKEEAKNKPSGALQLHDLDILVDGRQLSRLMAVKLDLSTGTVNEATITFAVEDLQVDADALAMLEAKVDADIAER